ncbi:MAG TPA: hypothetical protein VEU47_18855 [Candidatus Cybelea sp.]|nr:hypothetical protein [Candidatus Cybelea sp.]
MITIVVADQKRALYFGCWDRPGHYLHDEDGRTIWHKDRLRGFPWDDALMDTGLLHNGKHLDVVDGKVWWTCGGTPLWLAFVWWDRSVDRRGACNSGFYVQGFDHEHAPDAFAFACSVFPQVIERQRVPLVLQT